MSARTIAVGAAFATVFAAHVVWSQDVYVTLCRTHFTVTDAHGRIVTTLRIGDVTVYDNDAPQEISELGHHPDAPINLAVLIDRSQSVAERFPLLASAAMSFETSALAGPNDRGLLVAFDSRAYLLQDWTTDARLLATGIQRLRAAGGTSIFDAIFKTCRDKFRATDSQHNIVVLVTDGEDTTSVATFDQALQMATLSRVVVYVIGVGADHSLNTHEWQGRRVLSQLAELTGGRVFSAEQRSPDQLDTLFAKVKEEMRSGYTLTYYRDTPPDNSFHRIRIEPRDRTLVVHAPSGYYARALPRS